MLLSLLGIWLGVYASADRLAMADVWVVLAPAIAVVGGGVALTTALISRRTAVEERRAQRARRSTDEVAERPEVLLPPRLRCFVDRTEAIEEAIVQIGAGERMLAIAGGAGVGKSAVATELAHRLRAEEAEGALNLRAHDFLWIDGQDKCPTLADICQQLTLLTGDQSLSAVAEEVKLNALRAHLARNRTVLLLDNVKLDRGRSATPLHELLRTVPGGSLVIASLNSPYALDGPRVLLDELRPSHVVELIQHQARRLGLPEDIFDAEFAVRLQHAVGGNPRLIESFLLALSRSSRSVEELLEAVERGEGLRELYLPVWRELSEPSRAVLGACACLRGQAIAEQLAVACAIDRNKLSAPIEELMQMGLMTVLRSAGRPELYTCPHSLQRFAIAETQPSEVDAFARRLAGYYIRQFADEPENAQWAVPHVTGIKAVLQSLFDREEHAEVQALFASALDIFFTLGLFDDRISTGQLAYESAMRANNPRGASLAIDVVTSTHAARGELSEAQEAAGLGLIAAERSGDAGERARMMRAHALVLYKDGKAAQALGAMEGADELARETGDLEVLVNVWGLRTVAHWYLGAFERSAAAAGDGLRVCQEMSWQRAMAYPLRNLAEVAIHDADFAHARILLAEARRIAVHYADRRQGARIHLTASRLELFDGQLRASGQEALVAESEAVELGLAPEEREARAIQRAVTRARYCPPLRRFYSYRRPPRFTDAPIGGD